MKSVRKLGKGLAAAIMGAALVGGALGMSAASAEGVLGGDGEHAYDVRRGMYEQEGGSDTHVRRGMYQQENGQEAPKEAVKEEAPAPQETKEAQKAAPEQETKEAQKGTPEQEAKEAHKGNEPREYKYDVRRGMYQQEGGSDTEVRRGMYQQVNENEREGLVR